jgi:biotin carboxylase
VPAFDVLARVQDKLAAFATLAAIGVPQPPAAVVGTAGELARWERLPVFVKTPIGTATTGVRYVAEPAELATLACTWEAAGVFTDGGVLVQSPVAGQLVMVQSVFSDREASRS